MKPTLGRIVLVTTPGRAINGQFEHAAVVTQVHSLDDDPYINTKIMPGSGPVEDVTSIKFADPPREDAPSWRWPPRA